jgi:hypothetical protein
MYTTAFRTPTKKLNTDSQVRPRLRLARISSKLGINKHLKVFGKIATYKMKILMIIHRQMLLHPMLMSLFSNIKDSKQLKIMILMISSPLNIEKTKIYTIIKIS